MVEITRTHGWKTRKRFDMTASDFSAPTQNPRPSPSGAGANGDAARECVGAESTFRGLKIPLVPEMLAAALNSSDALRARISNVRLGLYPTTGGDEPIAFALDGVPHVGALRGRNRCLCLGFGEEADRAVAVRVFIDGDAQVLANKVNSTTC